jgi:hypothetical protein
MQMRMQLANPALIFIYSAVLLLVGVAIGLHWRASPCLSVWIAICAALLMVIHDLLEGLIWFGIAAKWAQMVKKSSSGNVPSEAAGVPRYRPKG